LVVAGIAWAAPSRADVPAQTCLPSLVTCAEGDVGKACPSGGPCESVFCRTDGSAMTMYRCIVTSDAGPATPDHDLTASGCDVASRAAGPGAIALVLLLTGALILLADRRRKVDR
jgi:hypothetical protein